MRLTSYNIAIKRHKAGCCLSELVERMWGYMEQGDTENAECVRQKALMLNGLIDVLCRWKPTIESGFITQLSTNYSTVVYPDPFIHQSTLFNGINSVSPFFAYGQSSGAFIAFGDSDEVVNCYAHAANSWISLSDDILQITMERTAPFQFLTTFISTSPLTGLTSNQSSVISGFPGGVVVVDNVAFSSVQVNCLTNEQVLSVIGKIDELCGCAPC